MDQVRCQLILQLRTKLRLKVDREVFLTLFARYKVLEEHMIELAGTKGKWLQDMMMERLGLTEWELIEGGQTSNLHKRQLVCSICGLFISLGLPITLRRLPQ